MPGDPIRERRVKYLYLVTGLLVKDLKFLVDEWEPEQLDNYAAQFLAKDPKVALGYVLTSLATLSGFELASERMAVPWIVVIRKMSTLVLVIIRTMTSFLMPWGLLTFILELMASFEEKALIS